MVPSGSLEAVVRNDAPRVRAVRELRGLIRNGQLPPGEALPAERALCRMLDVTRPALRWALGVLGEEGLIRAEGPRTRVVCEQRQTPVVNRALGRQAPLNSCVAILAPQSQVSKPGVNHVQMGWAEYIAYGAFRAITRLGRNSLAVGEGDFSDKDLDFIREVRPVGVVVPELAGGTQPKVQFLRALVEAGVRVAVYSGQPSLAEFDRVSSDHRKGAYQLAQHLVERGCRRIVCLWPVGEPSYWLEGRERGYRDAMRDAGLPASDVISYRNLGLDSSVKSEFDTETQYMAGVLLANKDRLAGVDAIMTVSDGYVAPLAAALRLSGREPGRDVLITGYDNYWTDCRNERSFEPAGPVATVDKQNLLMGEELARLLMDRIEGRLPPEPQCRVVEPKLVFFDPSGNTRTG